MKIYQPEYYEGDRLDMKAFLEHVDFKNKRVLEIGAGQGLFVEFIKLKKALFVDAVEYNSNCENNLIKKARNVFIGDAEVIDLKEKYDFIIMLDTLEHFKDPINFLKKIKKNLNKNGKLILSLPNNSHISFITSILFDKIDYDQKGGLLDYTHYHLFTDRSFRKWLRDSGFKVLTHKRKIPGRNKFLNIFTLGLFKHFFTFQNLYIITKY